MPLVCACAFTVHFSTDGPVLEETTRSASAATPLAEQDHPQVRKLIPSLCVCLNKCVYIFNLYVPLMSVDEEWQANPSVGPVKVKNVS